MRAQSRSKENARTQNPESFDRATVTVSSLPPACKKSYTFACCGADCRTVAEPCTFENRKSRGLAATAADGASALWFESVEFYSNCAKRVDYIFNMPTVTTTVTSASAAGATTTVTTTEATPDDAGFTYDGTFSSW